MTAAGGTAARRGRGRPPEPLFPPSVSDAWEVPPAVLPSEWAERYRVLADGDSDAPGAWRNDLAPYLKGPMNMLFKPGVTAMFIQKASQLGFSELLRILMGYAATQEPDPMGLVLPDKATGRKVISERIIPLFENTPVLAALIGQKRAKIQKDMLRLTNAFLLWLAWAGSPSTTKGWPWRVGVIDELDECALAVARLGQTRDLVGAVGKRTRTFGERARLIAVSTPLDVLSEIAAQVAGARFLLEFYLPCPACGGYQPLDFSHVRFAPDDAAVKADRRRWLAWVLEDPDRTVYQCRYCPATWREEQRPAIVRAGRWCSSIRQDRDGHVIGAAGVDEAGRPLPSDPAAGVLFDAESLEEFPRGSTLGIRIWAAYSLLGVTLSSIAAEFIAAQGDRAKMFTFTTETEGRVFEQELATSEPGLFVRKRERATLPEGVVPAWSGKLLAAIDTQIDHFVVVVRAWGEDFRSQRVWHGRIGTFAELETFLFTTAWRCEDESLGPMAIEMAGIDSGGTSDEDSDSSRTMQVYRWGQKHKARIRVLKGFDSSRTGQLLWLGKGILAENSSSTGQTASKRRREIPLWCLAKNHWQSVLQDYITTGLIRERRRASSQAAHTAHTAAAHTDADAAAAPETPATGQELWLLNQRADPVYERELANAKQIVDRSGTRPVQVWKPVHPGGRWDYRDAEVYQCVLASLARVDLLPPAEQIMAFRRELWKQNQAAEAAARAAAAGGEEAARKGGWINTGGKSWL